MPPRCSGIPFVTLLATASIFLASCAPQTKTLAPPVETPPTFSEAGQQAVQPRWWTAFDDARLNTVVDSALASNLTIKTAWQRLRAAQAVVDRAASALLPDLEASALGDVTRGSDTQQNAEQLQLGLSSVYEVDLWGRIRSQVEAERYRARATRADYQTATLSLSAEVTRTWYQLAEARSQLALVEAQIATNLTVLNLLENRFRMGQIRSVDILRQKQLVEFTREQKTAAEARIQVLQHRLAVLLGRPPQADLATVPDTLPALPPLPRAGVPVDLVRRRPDVRSAFNRLRAADRDLAAAISNQYPRLTLSASASSATAGADNLFKDWVLSFAGDLLAPIFYGGRLRAEVNRTQAVKRQRLYEYGQTVLVAFREVEDALIQEKKQVERLQQIDAQIDLARQAYEQLRVQYLNGTTDYLGVLTALEEVQQLRRDRLTAQLTLIEYRIALYRALAGSFETARERAN